MIVVQTSDVLQYVFGKLFGKHPIVPKLSPNKTIEGFFCGIYFSQPYRDDVMVGKRPHGGPLFTSLVITLSQALLAVYVCQP